MSGGVLPGPGVLAGYSALMDLAQTAHQGGTLSHQYGVLALQGAAVSALEAGRKGDSDD